MSEERENLVAYLYDEADANERRSVEKHLATCETCREELRAFRDVRQDLLAWDVPAHESVWKPFVTARTQPLWRQMPMWSLAAAAMVMFAIGGAGGFAGRLLASRAPEPTQAAAVQPAVQDRAPLTPAAATLEDLRALQARLGELERTASMRTMTAAPAASTASLDTASLARVEQLIKESEGRVTRNTMQRILSMVQDLGNQQRVDKALFQQQISDTQEQINHNILRVMNTRSPEKEQ